MRNRVAVAAAVLLSCAFALRAQHNIFKIEIGPSEAMVSLNEPVLIEGKYVFRAWPDGALASVPQARVQKITRLTGQAADTIYQVELLPSGAVTAREKPVLKGGMYVFHTWRDGTFMGVRQADVKKITVMTGDRAFWVEQGTEGVSTIGNLAMSGGGRVMYIGPSAAPARSNPGAKPPSRLGQGFYSNVVPGETQALPNSAGDNVVGQTWAYPPANATQSSPGGVPKAPQ